MFIGPLKCAHTTEDLHFHLVLIILNLNSHKWLVATALDCAALCHTLRSTCWVIRGAHSPLQILQNCPPKWFGGTCHAQSHYWCTRVPVSQPSQRLVIPLFNLVNFFFDIDIMVLIWTYLITREPKHIFMFISHFGVSFLVKYLYMPSAHCSTGYFVLFSFVGLYINT